MGSYGAPTLLAQDKAKEPVLVAAAGGESALLQARSLVVAQSSTTAQQTDTPATGGGTPTVEAAPTPVDAPAGSAAKPGGDDIEELQVTGSRIRRKDLTSPAPVAVIDTQTINNSGLVTIGEILQNLPSQANAINVQFNNGGTGSTRVNLRGLGTERTLVLLNGRRVVPGGFGADSSVDLNMIPVEIIERVEVLKDGASAIYGSDAISGVVNIITKKNFSGVEATAYYGATQRGGGIFQGAITAGDSTDRAGYVFSFQYFRQQDLLAGQRDFSESDLDFNFNSGGFRTEGSSGIPEGRVGAPTGAGNDTYQTLTGQAGSTTLYNDPVDGWREFRSTGNSDVGEGDFYNYQPENYLVTPSERYNFFGQAFYNITDDVELYSEALYSYRGGDRLLAPEPLFLGFYAEPVTVSSQNVYNPFGTDFRDVRRRMVEGSNRLFTHDVQTYRMVLGVRGNLPEDWGRLSTWTWDFSFNFGRTFSTEQTEGQYNLNRVRNASGPSFFDENGVARCGSPGALVDSANGCVPINFFGGAGSITPEMLDYITYTGIDRGFSEQRLFTFEMGGEIFELWNRPAALFFGFQHRREAGGFTPDPITSSGIATGNAARPTEGDFTETAGYAEVSVPLIADLPGIDVFEFNAAARVFDFDTFGTDFMYKVGGLWKITDDISIRGTYSRAFRAPNVSELFQGTSDDFPDVTDPCETSNGPRSVAAQANCSAEGLPDNLADDRTQIRSAIGGNENLDPETANTVTAGLVFTPTFAKILQGFSLTVDYFNIAIDNAIQGEGASVILANCYERGDAAACDQIIRNADSNLIVNILNPNTNIGEFNTDGIDISVRYMKGTPVGRFGVLFDGTWVNTFSSTLGDGTEVSGLNQYDLEDQVDGFVPSWRFNITLQWAYEALGLGYNLRYIRGIRECEDNNCNTDGDSNAPVRAVDANVTMDVFASYSFSTDLGYTSIRAGINNLADQEPPRIYAGFLANSDAANYDYLGRYFYLGVSHKL